MINKTFYIDLGENNKTRKISVGIEDTEELKELISFIIDGINFSNFNYLTFGIINNEKNN